MVILNVFWIIIIVSIDDLLLLKICYCCQRYVIQDGLCEYFFYVVNELQIKLVRVLILEDFISLK